MTVRQLDHGDLGTEHNFIEHAGATEMYLKRMAFDRDLSVRWHAHKTDHITALVRGKLMLETEVEGCREYPAPCFIFVAKGTRHRMTSEAAVVAYCIHITDHADPETIDASLIERKQNAS